MPILPEGTHSFSVVRANELGAWLSALHETQFPSHSYDTGPWQLVLEAAQTDPQFIARPAQRFTLHGTGAVSWEAWQTSTSSIGPYLEVAVTAAGPVVRLTLAIDGEETTMTFESETVEVAVPAIEESSLEWVVPAVSLGPNVLSDLRSLHWFDCVNRMAVRSIDPVVVEFEEREGDPTRLARMSAARVSVSDVPEDGELLVDGGLVDQADCWVEDGEITLRLVLHGGEIELSGPALHMDVEDLGPNDDDDD